MNWRKTLHILKWIALGIVGVMLILSGLLLIFKDNIKEYALEEINQHLNKKVHIGYIDVGIWKTFPTASLSFEDVLIYSKFDTLQTADTALYASQINLRFNPLDLMKGKYQVHRVDIKNGLMNMVVNEEGYVNYDFFKSKEDSLETTPFSFDLDKIDVEEMDFSYQDEVSEQTYAGFFNQLTFTGSFTDEQFLMKAKTDFLIRKIQNKSLTLVKNQNAKCKIAISMDRINDIFEITSADLSINKLPFKINGKIQGSEIVFFIGAKELNLPDVANNFSFQELDLVKKMKGKGRVNFDLSIQGDLDQDNGVEVAANFVVKNGSLKEKQFALSDIQLTGKYNNNGGGKGEQLKISSIHFVTLGEAFDGNLSITEFNRPRIVGEAMGKIDLAAIHHLFGPFGFESIQGNMDTGATFDLRLNHPGTPAQNLTVFHLNSVANLHHVQGKLIDDDRTFRIEKGNMTMQNQHVSINELVVDINSSDILLSAELDNVVGFYNKTTNLIVRGDISSTQLRIEDLLSTKKKDEKETKKKRSWLFPDNVQGRVHLTLDNIQYSGHDYKDVKGKMNIGNRSLVFPHVAGESGGANVAGNLIIKEEKPMFLTVAAQLASDNVFFKPLFKEWNNFEQEVITAENIAGKAEVNLKFKAPFDIFEETSKKEDYEIEAKIKIADGAIRNVETFKEITRNLKQSAAKLLISKRKVDQFEKRLLNLQFDTFENVFTIKNGVIHIPKISIVSNALSLNVEGTHSFDNEIDYAFDFRFREIKGDKQSEFGDVIDDETGFRVFLKMGGTIENPTFAWDKEASKAAQREKNERAKEDFKSALKTGFGIGKRDTTIQQIGGDENRNRKKKEDKIIMNFGDEEEEEVQPKKEKRGLGKKIEEWKKQKKEAEKSEEPVFELE